MTTEPVTGDDTERKKNRYHFDRHTPEYRQQFADITAEMLDKCPVAWSDTYGGHWVAAGHSEVFELARSAEYLSNDHDPQHERRGYKGISIPAPDVGFRGGFLEMDPPEQRHYRQAAQPVPVAGRGGPVDPAGGRDGARQPQREDRDRPDRLRRRPRQHRARRAHPGDARGAAEELGHLRRAGARLGLHPAQLARHARGSRRAGSPCATTCPASCAEIRANPRPGLIDALAQAEINGTVPPDFELLGVISLLIGGGFDTTTALTSRALEWLSEHPSERERLSRERDTLLDPATEEFLRYFTPAPGDGRTISADCEIAGQQFKEGERIWLSWAMSNRDPAVFPNPNEVDLARTGNRHHSFGLGIHRCIGSNVARMVFKRMVTAVLDRMPDYVCDPAGAEHYQTIGIIQGMKHLPATFTPGPRIGDGLDETIARMQVMVDEQRLADPVTVRKGAASIK